MSVSMIDEVLPEALEGERLDRVVAMLVDCSRSEASELVSSGSVQIDGEACTQRSMRVQAGMRIVAPEIDTTPELPTGDPAVNFEVVHEDDDIVVVDKPAGLIVHPGAGRPASTLVNGLLHRFPEIASVGQPERPGIVHRLDATTSGLLVVARTPVAYDGLVEAMAARTVMRVYTAVVEGLVSDERGVIDAPIGRSAQRRTRMAVTAEGRAARTHYEVDQRRRTEPEASRITCRLETGRTHQIRVHMTAIGHPVVGDAAYGAGRGIEFERVALHARGLGFSHPVTRDWMSFLAAEPADLAELINRLELD